MSIRSSNRLLTLIHLGTLAADAASSSVEQIVEQHARRWW